MHHRSSSMGPVPWLAVLAVLLLSATFLTVVEGAAVSIGNGREKRAVGSLETRALPKVVGGAAVSPKFKYPFVAAILLHDILHNAFTSDLKSIVSVVSANLASAPLLINAS